MFFKKVKYLIDKYKYFPFKTELNYFGFFYAIISLFDIPVKAVYANKLSRPHGATNRRLKNIKKNNGGNRTKDSPPLKRQNVFRKSIPRTIRIRRTSSGGYESVFNLRKAKNCGHGTASLSGANNKDSYAMRTMRKVSAIGIGSSGEPAKTTTTSPLLAYPLSTAACTENHTTSSVLFTFCTTSDSTPQLTVS